MSHVTCQDAEKVTTYQVGGFYKKKIVQTKNIIFLGLSFLKSDNMQILRQQLRNLTFYVNKRK